LIFATHEFTHNFTFTDRGCANLSNFYSGCNIENASYGGTVCAERVAILKARSEGPIEIKELLCITESNPPWPPCGMCLQVITEFAKPNALIHIANNEGVVNTLTLEDLLPKAFSAEHLHTHLGRK